MGVQLISLVQHWLPDALELLRSPLGAVAFIPLYALWVTLLLPGVWASMLAGVLYGTWVGSGLVFVGASLGAVVVFLLGRTVLRDWAQRRLEQLPKPQAGERRASGTSFSPSLLTARSTACSLGSCSNRRWAQSRSTVRPSRNTTTAPRLAPTNTRPLPSQVP